ncbi:MAG: rhomboid family intramembrane serine protease [Kiritimatiellae bacterium]|nr:rhomboid family intramembrane serine protease [Kiritimatiellia bacterium]MCO5061286.1 rhomboid family intramembrane serine protease [Kiritimatiellia bacterium]MCO6400204.1 rhomboid family intramembrane serine protease [Verrucomicrobiota bacterium]
MRINSWRIRMGLPPATFWLLFSLVAVYLLQVFNAYVIHLPLESFFGLSISGIMQGHLWQFLTYQFLHGGTMHIVVNGLMFYFLGAEVERAMGRRHFLLLYFLSGVIGGLGWTLFTYPYAGVCVGASAAIFGLLSAFAVLYPQREVTLLLMFVFPVTLKAWVLALGLGLIQVLFTISPSGGGIAYSAHLAGGLAGLIYTITVFRPELWGALVGRSKSVIATHTQARTIRHAEANREEMDRLLDKISRDGIHALTPAERRRLEEISRARGKSR